MEINRICNLRQDQIDGDALRVFTTTFVSKVTEGTRLIAGSKGKKVKNWVIRSQTSKPARQGHEEGSTTRWFWTRGM